MTSSAKAEAQEIESSCTGQAPLTGAEAEIHGRALSKGYGETYDAYKVGVRDGVRAALEARDGRQS